MANSLRVIEENRESGLRSALEVPKERKERKMKLHRFKKRTSELHIKARRPEFCQAMSQSDRMKTSMRNVFSTQSSEATDSEEQTEEDPSFRQFTISRRKKRNIKAGLVQLFSTAPKSFFTFGSVKSLNNVNTETTFGFFPNPNKVLIDFLNWMYSTSFSVLFFCCALFFYVITISFALVIMWIGMYQEKCIKIGNTTYGTLTSVSGFVGAFTLSWTTLSTVGYGNTSPSVDDEKCMSVNFLLMMESFIGVTYAGFCGAILFGKLMRFQSRAPVVFSDPVVIRFGEGLNDQDNFDVEEPIKGKNNPPLLEFRVLNLMHEEPGGEIMSAVLHVVASTHVKNVDTPLVKRQIDRSGDFNNLAQDEQKEAFSDSPVGNKGSERRTHRLKRRKRKTLKQYSGATESEALFDEGNEQLMPKIIFSNLEVAEPQHPLFKRTWVGKHILNKDSPLLKEKVKQKLRINDDKWPDDLYNTIGIQDSLEFNQIIVSITGVSNVSGSDVYAHNIYDRNDVVIGFEFVDLLIYENDKPKVDMNALHCVVEQIGGGCQTMDVLCESNHEVK